MSIPSPDCCILNSGNGAWAFETLALQLSTSLGVEVAHEPRRFNYLLHFDDSERLGDDKLFIPLGSIQLAADKRLLAVVFHQHGVPIPRTRMTETFENVRAFVAKNSADEWCLKYPTSCGANGHRLISPTSVEPPNWPRPFLVQQFIRLEHPEVYRIFCAAGEMFGWVARRFPEGSAPSSWVAHARGARYVRLDQPPLPAAEAARSALIATNLWNSFGCVDLLRKPSGEWVVLEVGTDGVFNHVDRDLGDSALERELGQRIARAFWNSAERRGIETVPSQSLPN